EIGIALSGDIAPDVLGTILADPVRLTQVLSNLVSNALKFTMSGSVVIEVAEAGQGGADGRRHLALSVRDTGIGIAADKLEAIFDAFTQASQSTTRQFGGTGIGLTICRRLVGAMGGTISVASEPGKGSTFRVEAPFEVVEPERPIAVPAANQRRVVVALAGSATRNVVTKALVARGIAARPVDPLDPASVAAACGFGDPSLPPLAAFIADDGRALPLMRMLCGGALEKKLASPDRPLLATVVAPGTPSLQSSDRAPADIELPAPILPADLDRLADRLAAGTPSSEPAPVPMADSVARTPASPQNARVLVVDDSLVNREVMSAALGRLGHRATLAGNGLEALERLASAQFDIVFMDLSMPVMDGLEATRRIRASEAESGLPRLPVIAVTAHAAGRLTSEWQEAGLSDFVTKPFTLERIAAVIARWWAAGDGPAREAAGSQEP
ncbi:MAG: response regulator, partial [Verrucomicrobiae bacterium]|nr:response regulator [Verrucomicrobiae bacterium]